jgi:uncharacterized membrane protein
MANRKMIFSAISALLTLKLAAISGDVLAQTSEMGKAMEIAPMKGVERCYGISKAHQNDCGTASHLCAGEAKIDNDKNEWILVPTGVCNKIAGGKTKAT